MDALLSRVTPTDLEIRGGDGRTVFGLFVPFDRETVVNDGAGPYREVFRYGSLARTINSGRKIPFLVNHDRQRLPIGSSLSLREDKAGGVGEFKVSKTREGDEVLELVRDGALSAFSVGFAPVKERQRGDLVERTEVKLREVSVVAFPAYEDAAIAGVRSESDLFALLDDLDVDSELGRRLVEYIQLRASIPMDLATDLRTLAQEPAERTSEQDPQDTPTDPVIDHSAAPNNSALRFALAAFCAGLDAPGGTHEQA